MIFRIGLGVRVRSQVLGLGVWLEWDCFGIDKFWSFFMNKFLRFADEKNFGVGNIFRVC